MFPKKSCSSRKICQFLVVLLYKEIVNIFVWIPSLMFTSFQCLDLNKQISLLGHDYLLM